MNKHIPKFNDFINEEAGEQLATVSFTADIDKAMPDIATDAAEAYALEINIGKEKTTITGAQSDIDDFLKDYEITPDSE